MYQVISIRMAVFVDEQGIDEKIDFDGHNKTALHVLVFLDGLLHATARILSDGSYRSHCSN